MSFVCQFSLLPIYNLNFHPTTNHRCTISNKHICLHFEHTFNKHFLGHPFQPICMFPSFWMFQSHKILIALDASETYWTNIPTRPCTPRILYILDINLLTFIIQVKVPNNARLLIPLASVKRFNRYSCRFAVR